MVSLCGLDSVGHGFQRNLCRLPRTSTVIVSGPLTRLGLAGWLCQACILRCAYATESYMKMEEERGIPFLEDELSSPWACEQNLESMPWAERAAG